MLCSTCQGIFTRPRRPPITDVVDDDDEACYHWGEPMPHHLTEESFRQAVADGCYICATVDNVPLHELRETIFDWGSSPETYWKSNFRIGYERRGVEGNSRVEACRLRIDTIYKDELRGLTEQNGYFHMVSADGRMPDFNVRANERLAQIRTWMTACCQQHEWGCAKYRDHQWLRPSRLIDVGPIEQDFVTLALDEDTTELNAPYITMSHRWLTPKPPVLKRDNIENLKKEGISLSDLPQSFQDAVNITRNLRVKYLWIDSLCILQDSEEDFHREAEGMGHIYAGGVFNIVASNSYSWGTTLFPSRVGKDLVPIVHPSWTEMGNYKAFAICDSWIDASEEALSGKLFRRGWIHQEIHLAPSNLFCATDQLWWVCLEGSYCEAYPRDLNNLLDNGLSRPSRLGAIRTLIVPSINPPSYRKSRGIWLPQGGDNESFAPRRFMYMWMELVEDYSGSTTTESDDKLVAIGGIVKLCQEWMRKTLSSQEIGYYSGMWRLFFLEQLSWNTRCVSEAYRRCRRWTGTYTIPSWSWASVNGAIHFSTPSWSRNNQLILPEAAEVSKPLATIPSLEARQTDPYGREDNQSILEVHGMTLRITFDAFDDKNLEPIVFARTEIEQLKQTGQLLIRVTFDCYEELLGARNNPCGYTVMPLFRDKRRNSMYRLRGIVLYRVGKETPLYRRCGYFDNFYFIGPEEYRMDEEQAMQPRLKLALETGVVESYLIT
ncbi:HET-domain-containing protein [Hypoxylon sp. EC38]|nr:HET-domain-containing protein [Hypoxylon sp. EC38]